jgi:hypothetical protein
LQIPPRRDGPNSEGEARKTVVTTTRSRTSRRSDAKILAAATVAVLLAGGLIAAGLLAATRGSRSTVCGPLTVGAASDVRSTLDGGGPYLATGGGSCSFWLAVEDGDIVAYKIRQPEGCTLELRRGERWMCGGDVLEPTDLDRYPVSIQTVDDVDSVVVDLRPPPRTSTT